MKNEGCQKRHEVCLKNYVILSVSTEFLHVDNLFHKIMLHKLIASYSSLPLQSLPISQPKGHPYLVTWSTQNVFAAVSSSVGQIPAGTEFPQTRVGSVVSTVKSLAAALQVDGHHDLSWNNLLCRKCKRVSPKQLVQRGVFRLMSPILIHIPPSESGALRPQSSKIFEPCWILLS